MDGQNNVTGNQQTTTQGNGTEPQNTNQNTNTQSTQNTNQQQNTNTNQQHQNERTFTQAEVNAMMAREKNDGRRSVLAELGLGDDLEAAKKSVEGYNKYLEAQKTEAEKQAEAIQKANKASEDAMARAAKAEAKLTAISKGVKSDVVEDVVVIALQKVSKDKSLEAVLDEMAKNEAYASFFTTNTSNTNTVNRKVGTGTGVNNSSNRTNNNGTGAGTLSLGARLAQGQVTKAKSSFFAR